MSLSSESVSNGPRQASGRPVITTATPQIAADYGDLCIVLDREELQALADAIMKVAAMPAADRLARAAGARVAVIERCAWSRQGRRLVRFLEESSAESEAVASGSAELGRREAARPALSP